MSYQLYSNVANISQHKVTVAADWVSGSLCAQFYGPVMWETTETFLGYNDKIIMCSWRLFQSKGKVYIKF